MLNVNLLSGHAHCGTFPLVPGRLVKCLSGAIKFEYRIRPDWQDIMLMSTGFANGDLVYDFPQRTSAFASIGFWITVFFGLLLWETSCTDWIICLHIFKRGCGIGTQQEISAQPSSAQHSNEHNDRGRINIMMILSVTMSCMTLLGVFALLLSRGRWPVFSAGVPLRQHGAGGPSKISKDSGLHSPICQEVLLVLTLWLND